jgi:hypothetical protein
MECLHGDGDRANNRLGNLRWGTPDENVADRVRHGSLIPAAPVVDPEPILFFDDFIPIESIIPAEVWRAVPGYEGLYQASNFGRLRSRWVRGHRKLCDEWTILRGIKKRYGYIHHGLRDQQGNCRSRGAHRIVYEAFAGIPPDGIDCRHLDGNSGNNHLSNLRWSTRVENIRDRTLHGTDNRGERCGSAILTAAKVREIRRRREAGERICRIAADFPEVAQSTLTDICRRRTWRHI